MKFDFDTPSSQTSVPTNSVGSKKVKRFNQTQKNYFFGKSNKNQLTIDEDANEDEDEENKMEEDMPNLDDGDNERQHHHEFTKEEQSLSNT